MTVKSKHVVDTFACALRTGELSLDRVLQTLKVWVV